MRFLSQVERAAQLLSQDEFHKSARDKILAAQQAAFRNEMAKERESKDRKSIFDDMASPDPEEKASTPSDTRQSSKDAPGDLGELVIGGSRMSQSSTRTPRKSIFALKMSV